MKRVNLRSVIFGSKVKLTLPKGKVYTVVSSMGFGKPIILRDDKGKEIEKPYGLSVYLIN